MFTKTKQILFMALLVALGSGCVTTQHVWRSEPVRVTVDKNPYFVVEITPYSIWEETGYNAFAIHIKNKTDKTLKLDWNKTYFIQHGQTFGGFCFDGLSYLDCSMPKEPDIIFPNGQLLKNVWPVRLMRLGTTRIYFENFEEGVNGAYLTVIADGKEISEKLTITIRSYLMRK